MFFNATGVGTTFDGCTVAVESGDPWVVDYRLRVDDRWRTRSAEVTARSRLGSRTVRLEHDGAGRWLLDGVACELLDGCLDVDLEASSLTNTFPVHRFFLAPGTARPVSTPAAFVRAQTVSVERLEQSYRRLPDGPDGSRFDYAAPVFDVSCVIAYDASGLVLDYPGLALRQGVARGVST